MKSPRRLRHALWVPATIILAAAWIDLSHFHESVHADGLIPILSSLYGWEPFYWEQSRLGMLVPLLASQISNPWHNFLLQNLVAIASGLTLLILMVRYVYSGRGWWQIALASVATFLFAAPPSTQYLLMSTASTYGMPLLLGLVALLIARSNDRSNDRSRSRLLVAAILLSIIAHWLNGSTALLLVPLVITRAALRATAGKESQESARPLTEAMVGCLILSAGFAVGQLLAWASPYPLHHLRVLDPGRWPEAWSSMAASAWREAKGPFATLFLVSGAIGLVIGMREHSQGRPARALRLALPLCLTATAYWLLIGASEWVALNRYHHRYALPAVLCLHTAAMIAMLVPLAQRRQRGGFPLGTVASSLLLVAALVWSYGLPSSTRARDAVDKRLGDLSEDVRAANATHVLGTYGTVWTTVYHTNLLRYEEGR